MNGILGKIGTLITGISVLAFAVSMMFGLFMNTVFLSCFVCILIAIGFLLTSVSLFSLNRKEDRQAAGLAGIVFAVVYAVLILLVYYAECTTVRMNENLGREALSIISYSSIGSLFFNYDLLGYGFMALSTFFLSFCIQAADRSERIYRMLLRVHGVFFPPCLIIPMLPVFAEGTSDLFGTLILEVWCLFFLPVCVLGLRYFHKRGGKNPACRP